MEIMELLLTILIGVLIAHFVVKHEGKKPRTRGASAVPPTTILDTESPITNVVVDYFRWNFIWHEVSVSNTGVSRKPRRIGDFVLPIHQYPQVECR